MDSNSYKTVTAIVVGQLTIDKFFVWCKENQANKDGILTTNRTQPVTIGSWVNIKLPKLGNIGNQQFEVSSYTVIPGIYKTECEGKTIRVKLEQYLLEDQKEIDHNFFGKIYNNMSLNFSSGLYYLTIKRIKPKSHMESVWVMENVDTVPEKPADPLKELIGIVAGSDGDFYYIWTKERPIGMDITIKKGTTVILGSWVRLTVPRDQMGVWGLECTKYTVIPEMYKTEIIGRRLALQLECWIPAGSENIWHPFLGDILNKSVSFPKSGKLLITIFRKAAATWNGVDSVWSLMENPVLLEESVSTHPTHRSLVDHFRPEAQPAEPLGLLAQLRKQESLMNSVTNLNLESQGDRIPQQRTTTRARSQSRHRSKSRNRNKTPLPTPRRSLESPQEGPSTTRNPNSSNFCKAIILKIVKNGDREDIFVWIFDEKTSGQLRLNVAAEKLALEPGKVFRAPFTERYEKWCSYGPVSDIQDDEYRTRENQNQALEILVEGKALGSPDLEHSYFPWIAHDDFGDILDNRSKLQNHIGLVYRFWIKRSKTGGDKHGWVVVEQDLTGRNLNY